MKLIPNVGRAARLWSVRVPAFGAAIFGALLAAPDQALAIWSALPPEVQALVPGTRQFGLALSAAAIVARLIKQKDADDGE
jgi:hypothetical protein